MTGLTPRQKDAIVAFVNGGGLKGGALIYGASENTMDIVLTQARRKLGAASTAHAVALTFRELQDRYVLPGDQTR